MILALALALFIGTGLLTAAVVWLRRVQERDRILHGRPRRRRRR